MNFMLIEACLINLFPKYIFIANEPNKRTTFYPLFYLINLLQMHKNKKIKNNNISR